MFNFREIHQCTELMKKQLEILKVMGAINPHSI